MADPMTIVQVIKMPCETPRCGRTSTIWVGNGGASQFHMHACTRCALNLLRDYHVNVLSADTCGHFRYAQVSGYASGMAWVTTP
jgi:hypothetical protein